jgi:hypothetical protein
MDRQSYLLEMRQNHTLKGLKPCFVSLRFNAGKIYNDGYGEFIMSLKDGKLYFQKLSRFLKKLKPKDDFSLNADRFIEYRLEDKSFMKILYLYDDSGRYIDICYQAGRIETSASEDNVRRIIDELCKQHNLKPFKEEEYDDSQEEGNDSTGEGSN